MAELTEFHIIINGVDLFAVPSQDGVTLEREKETTITVAIDGRATIQVATYAKYRTLRITSGPDVAIPYTQKAALAGIVPGDAVTVAESYTNREQLTVWNAVAQLAPVFTGIGQDESPANYYGYEFNFLVLEA